MGLRERAVTHEHAIVAGWLPRHHSDPFDRMLIAQAVTEVAQAVTEVFALASREDSIALYEVDLLRV